MKANINNQLKPQLEEDITAIEWINSKNFEEKKELFYPLISGLISNFLNLSER
jgi:hypothetical protein